MLLIPEAKAHNKGENLAMGFGLFGPQWNNDILHQFVISLHSSTILSLRIKVSVNLFVELFQRSAWWAAESWPSRGPDWALERTFGSGTWCDAAFLRLPLTSQRSSDLQRHVPAGCTHTETNTNKQIFNGPWQTDTNWLNKNKNNGCLE